ncbi:mucin-binding protein, partial [Ligilactobacillus salivarius]|uniref:mucin-binding protein n=1 Tax=Ligilactobacillus salivarius TaxID=1624 RepID=UPI001CDBB0D2
MGEKKLHYKMYKDGKKFVFAAIATLSFFVFGGVSTVAVHADTTSGNLTAATVNSTSDTKSAGSSAATVASSASDTKSAGSSAATVASSASDTKSAGSSAATVASSASDTKADSTSASSSSAGKAETTSASSSSAGKAETTSASSSSAVKSDTASTVSSSAAKSDTASTASSSAAKSDTASTASSGAAKSDTASTASSSAAKSDTASTASSSAAKSDTASTASSSAAKSDTANTASSSATKSTNVDASESSGTSENTTSSTNNTASSGDDDQSVDMNGIHHYIPLHPERGADPSDNRWGALMKYWDTWYGVGYQVSDSKPASGGPGSPIWPGSGSTAVWPVGSDYASMNRFITRTIEYRDKSTGELITGVTPVVQKVHYGVAFVMDLVTGEILGYMTPNTNGTFPDKPTIQHRADAWYVIGNSNFTAVTSPDLSSKGYLAPDLATVAQQKVNPGDQDDTVNVYYDHAVVPVNPTNPQTPGTPINPDDPDSPKWPVGTDKDSLTTDIHQTIHYQYGDGSQAAPDKTDSTTFEHQVEIDKVTGEVVKDDGWTAKNGKTSFDAVVSPVVPGSVADKAQTAAVTDLNADSADVNETVTYTKVGSLVPSSSDGNFPGAPKVVYPNDPSDATKVTPAGVPTVPGYTAHDPEGHVLTPGSSYQPSDPTKDTTITYTADTQKGSVSYVDDTTGKTLKTDSISGTTGSKSSYSTSGSIADYKKQGYELVTDGYPA